MKILMICGVYDEASEQYIFKNSKGYLEQSANIFQKKIIYGIEQNNIVYQLFSAPFIGSYPNRFNKIFFSGFPKPKENWFYTKFCNIWGLRNIFRSIALKKSIRKNYIKDNEENLIIVYGAHTPFLNAAMYAKKRIKNSKVCFVCPDLPQFMNLNKNKKIMYDLFKKYDIKRMYRYIDKVDSFLLLTENMKNVLNVGNRPYQVCEGIITEEKKYTNKSKTDDINKMILYAGKTNYLFGIKDLIEAFKNIKNEHLFLVICGDGDARNFIEEQIKIDNRIKYIGQVTEKKALELIACADILVNPRQNNDEYTKYSFPSKNIEYLLSGNIVVTSMLDGMPQDYKEFIYEIEGNDIEKALRKALEADSNEISSKTKKAYDYINKKLVSKYIIENIVKMNFDNKK